MRLDFQISFPLMDKGNAQAAGSSARNIYGNVSNEIAPYVNMFGAQANQSFTDQVRQMNESEQGYLANQATLQGLGPYGGMDQQYVDKTNQGFSNFVDTGGVSPGQIAMTMNQAIDPVAANAANMEGAARRSSAATGGDAGAAIAAIQGEVGGQQATAANQANLGLINQIQQGKLAGLGGLAGFQGQLANARQGVAGLQNQVASGLGGLYGQSSANTNAAQNQILSALGLKYGTQVNATQIMQQLSRNPGLFQTMIGDIGSLAGAAGGVMAGMGGV